MKNQIKEYLSLSLSLSLSLISHLFLTLSLLHSFSLLLSVILFPSPLFLSVSLIAKKMNARGLRGIPVKKKKKRKKEKKRKRRQKKKLRVILYHGTGCTRTTTSGTGRARTAACVACAAAQQVRCATPPIVSSTPSSPGACPTPATATTTGPASTAAWSGTAFSPPPSPTLSPWGNRWFMFICEQCACLLMITTVCVSRVSDQNNISLQWYIVVIYHSGRKLSICGVFCLCSALWSGAAFSVPPSQTHSWWGSWWFMSICEQCACLLMPVCISRVSNQNGISLQWYWGFRTRMVYLYCISCLRYTILVRNPRYIVVIYHCGRKLSICGVFCLCGALWSGTAFSPPPSPTLSSWGSWWFMSICEQCACLLMLTTVCVSRVSNQNGISRQWYI